jgi:hypothetical protein
MSVKSILNDLQNNNLSTEDVVRTLELDLADAWDRLPVNDKLLQEEVGGAAEGGRVGDNVRCSLYARSPLS